MLQPSSAVLQGVVVMESLVFLVFKQQMVVFNSFLSFLHSLSSYINLQSTYEFSYLFLFISFIYRINLTERYCSVYKNERRMIFRAQLEQSKNRLCLNLNRQKKDSVPSSKETSHTSTTQSTSSRGYRVSDISGIHWFFKSI